MSRFQIRGGDFIGIIIPGIILLFNIYLLFYHNIESSLHSVLGITPMYLKEDILSFLIITIVAYIIGIMLRVLNPNFPDRISAIMRIIFKYKDPHKGLRESFPYFIWFINSALHSIPINKKGFNHFVSYSDLTINHKIYVNYCKLFVMNKSEALGQEVLFAEGLSRMVCGISYSTLISLLLIIVALFSNSVSSLINIYVLLVTNVIMFIAITWGVRQLRVKEITTILLSYALLLK